MKHRDVCGAALSALLVVAYQASGAPTGRPSEASATVDSSAARSSISQAPGESRVLHFAVVDAFTGPQAIYGNGNKFGILLRAKEINDAGGFTDSCGNHYTIDVTTNDADDSPQAATALLRGAAADPTVLAVMGPSASTYWLAMIPVAGQLRITLLSNGTGAPVTTWNPWVYRDAIVPPVALPIVMKQVKDLFHIMKVAVIVDTTNDAQVSDAQTVRDLAPTIGYEIVAYTTFRAGDVDMRPQLTRIKAANPDWIAYETSGGQLLATVFNQALELGLGNIPKYSSFTAWADAKTWDLTGGKASGGYSWAPTKGASSKTDPKISEFLTSYKNFSGLDANNISVRGYDLLGLSVDAVKKTCSATDRAAFNQAVRESRYDGLQGTISFGKDTGDVQVEGNAVGLVQTTERGLYKVVTGP